MKMYEKNGVRIPLSEVHADAFKRFGWKKVAEIPAEPVSVTKAVSESVAESTTTGVISDSKLNEMTKEELLEYAKKIGVNASERANKAQIINAIRERQKK